MSVVVSKEFQTEPIQENEQNSCRNHCRNQVAVVTSSPIPQGKKNQKKRGKTKPPNKEKNKISTEDSPLLIINGSFISEMANDFAFIPRNSLSLFLFGKRGRLSVLDIHFSAKKRKKKIVTSCKKNFAEPSFSFCFLCFSLFEEKKKEKKRGKKQQTKKKKRKRKSCGQNALCNLTFVLLLLCLK